MQIFVSGARAVGLEELDQVRLVCFFETFEIQDFAEVGVGFVGDMNQVGLDESFGWGGPDLECFEDGVNA